MILPEPFFFWQKLKTNCHAVKSENSAQKKIAHSPLQIIFEMGGRWDVILILFNDFICNFQKFTK